MAMKRPRPVPDELTQAFWDQAQNEVLCIPRCQDCSTYIFPADFECWNCRSSHIVPESVSGRARLVSWTEVAQPIVGGFESGVPYTCFVVELVEQPGLYLVSDFPGPVEAVPGGVQYGMDMAVTFRREDNGFLLPQFRPMRTDNGHNASSKGVLQ